MVRHELFYGANLIAMIAAIIATVLSVRRVVDITYYFADETYSNTHTHTHARNTVPSDV